MKNLIVNKAYAFRTANSGMEMVQVAILIAIAIAAGLIFRTQIANFINGVFDGLSSDSFQF